jgi:peptidoglycan-associated lipoprotein
MSDFAKKPVLFLLAVTLIGLTGCPKRPVRPDPSQTAIGDGGAAYSTTDSLNATGVDTYDPLLDESAMGLTTRGDGVIETDDMIRGLLEPIYFDFDKSGIKAAERVKLDAAIMYLDANPNHRLLMEGHCDWRGTGDYNLGLGDRRAGSAREYLETAGVDASRLETSSKGDLEAIENGDDSQMAQDRRVDLVVLKY